jgi:hypothetical protein
MNHKGAEFQERIQLGVSARTNSRGKAQKKTWRLRMRILMNRSSRGKIWEYLRQLHVVNELLRRMPSDNLRARTNGRSQALKNGGAILLQESLNGNFQNP